MPAAWALPRLPGEALVVFRALRQDCAGYRCGRPH